MKKQQLHTTFDTSFILLVSFGIFASTLHNGLFSFKIPTAQAQEISISSYPSTIQLHSQELNPARAGFTIANKTAESIRLKIALKPFKPDTTNDGKLIYIEGNDPAIFKKIQILDNGLAIHELELGPKQSKQLALEVATSENEANSDYYFSIIFLTSEPTIADETSEDATAKSIAQAGLAVNVLLQTGQEETPNGSLEEFSTGQFRTAGPVPFNVKIKNNGNHYFTPKGVILIKNIFNQTVGRIDLQNANILVGTSRSLVGIPYQETANNKTTFLSQNPQWPEKFLLGFYTAELSVALSDEGPVLTDARRFLAIPIQVFIVIAIAVLAILFITLRIRKKLKNL